MAETRRRSAIGEMGVMSARKTYVVTAGKMHVTAACESYVMTRVRSTHCGMAGMAEHRGMRRAHRAVREHRMAGARNCRMAEAGRVHRPETMAETAAAESAVKASAATVKAATAAGPGQREPACGHQEGRRQRGMLRCAE